jgi:hypothetical protein
MFGISMRAANDVWAAGWYVDEGATDKPLYLQWDGAAWSIVDGPVPDQIETWIQDIEVVPGGDVWAVGQYRDIENRVHTLTMRYGNPCQPIPAITPTPTLTRTPTPTLTRTPTATPTRTVTPCVMNFTDVQQTDYFYEPVRYLYCTGVISGYPDNTFKPYNNTTRGQLTKIVVLAFQIPVHLPSQPTFTDVDLSNPFYQYVETAAHEGLVAGYADGTFRPFNNVTRGQLCKIVAIAAGWTLISPPAPTFSDVPVDNPFYTYIETAYEHEIISGYSDGTFKPYNNATRGQISKIVYNAVSHRR